MKSESAQWTWVSAKHLAATHLTNSPTQTEHLQTVYIESKMDLQSSEVCPLLIAKQPRRRARMKLGNEFRRGEAHRLWTSLFDLFHTTPLGLRVYAMHGTPYWLATWRSHRNMTTWQHGNLVECWETSCLVFTGSGMSRFAWEAPLAWSDDRLGLPGHQRTWWLSSAWETKPIQMCTWIWGFGRFTKIMVRFDNPWKGIQFHVRWCRDSNSTNGAKRNSIGSCWGFHSW